MDPISQKYQNASQGEMDYIEKVTQAFQTQCEQLRTQTEQKISALDPNLANRQDQENLFKLELKRSLDKLVEEYEKEIKRSFIKSIVSLEDIYHEKELIRLAELEKEILIFK